MRLIAFLLMLTMAVVTIAAFHLSRPVEMAVNVPPQTFPTPYDPAKIAQQAADLAGANAEARVAGVLATASVEGVVVHETELAASEDQMYTWAHRDIMDSLHATETPNPYPYCTAGMAQGTACRVVWPTETPTPWTMCSDVAYSVYDQPPCHYDGYLVAATQTPEPIGGSTTNADR